MRWSYSGDLSEAQKWTGRVTQELYRLRTLMLAQKVEQQKRFVQLSDTAYCILDIAAGIEAAHIVTGPVPTGDTNLPYFEFGTSGYPVETWDGSLAGTDFTAYNGCVVGGTFDKNLQISAKVLTGQRQHFLNLASKVGRLFQAQLEDGHASYTRAGAIFGSYAPTNPYTGIYDASLNAECPFLINPNGGAEQAFSKRDIGFDVPLEYNTQDSSVTLAVLRDDADWPRATAIQRAGGRDFAIYIDAFAQVFVFPLTSIAAFSADFTQNVPAIAIKMRPVSFPTWAFVPPAKAMTQVAANVDNWYARSPDLLWKFNHLGTKAVCVLHERERAIQDDAYINDPDTIYNFANGNHDPKKFRQGRNGTRDRFWAAADQTAVDGLYTFGRGVFEIDIAITVSGPLPQDFAVVVTGNEVRTPRGSDRGTFMVDYAWHSIPSKDIQAGDMLLFDIERWYESSAAVTDTSAPTAGNWNLDEGGWLPQSQPMWDWLTDNAHRYNPLRESEYLNLAEFLRNLWSEPVVTGRAMSFFSLRRRRNELETEVIAVPGEALFGIDLKTASFVVALESIERVNRTVSLATDTPGPMIANGWTASATMPYVISHPGVSVYTQATLRTVLIADGVNDTVAADLRAQAAVDPRTVIVGWTYMPANDLRNWSSLSGLRDIQLYLNDQTLFAPLRLPSTPPAHVLQATTVEQRNWWLAMCVNYGNLPLILAQNPNFGWALYTAEIINRNQNTNTTFFTHPNGSWAFYDHNRIYNTYGVPDIFQVYDATNINELSGKYDGARFGALHGLAFLGTDLGRTDQAPPVAYLQMLRNCNDLAGPAATYVSTNRELTGGAYNIVISVWDGYDTITPALSGSFKHQIFDHIHFEHKGTANDTSFFALYNAAVARLTEGSDILSITSEQLRATLTPTTSVDQTGLPQMALKINWAGQELYAIDRAYNNQFDNNLFPYPSYGHGTGGLLLKARLCSAFSTTAAGGTLNRFNGMPVTFSTCFMFAP